MFIFALSEIVSWTWLYEGPRFSFRVPLFCFSLASQITPFFWVSCQSFGPRVWGARSSHHHSFITTSIIISRTILLLLSKSLNFFFWLLFRFNSLSFCTGNTIRKQGKKIKRQNKETKKKGKVQRPSIKLCFSLFPSNLSYCPPSDQSWALHVLSGPALTKGVQLICIDSANTIRFLEQHIFLKLD